MTALTDPLAEGAVQAVLEAGELLADPAAVRSIRAKSETDYVTNVDLAVQEFLRERLAALAPDVQFMGEEQDNSALDLTRPCWILDPVDGTTNLIHQFQHSAISLALAEGGWTNHLRCGIQSLYGGVLRRLPGRRSIPKRGFHPGQRCLPAGGQPSVHRHRSRPPGSGGHGISPDAGAVRPVPGRAPHRLRQPGAV